MDSSNVFTAPRSIPDREWDLPFANVSSIGLEAESGWNPSSDEVRRFSLPYPSPEAPESVGGRAGVSILLVEDNPGDANLVREALLEHGVQGELLVAGDGETAIRLIDDLDRDATGCPDLVVLDLNLPKRPGREVLEHMRASSACRHIPVVILSSSDSERDREETARLGATKYLKKPARLDDFLKLGRVFRDMLGGS